MPAAPMADHGSLQAPDGLEVAVLAGGCFWGMEEIIREIPGVKDTEVGYAGGKVDRPTYDDVKKGTSGHAESIRVVFDPKVLSFEDLLAKWFFKMHDPTTANRQGNDVGSQYRSAIFVLSDAQRAIAQKVIMKVNASGNWDEPVVTQVVNAGPFTPAESYHQGLFAKDAGRLHLPLHARSHRHLKASCNMPF